MDGRRRLGIVERLEVGPDLFPVAGAEPMGDPISAGLLTLPSGDVLAREFQRFLRQRGEG